MLNLALTTWTTRLLVWLCSWIRSNVDLASMIGLAELWILWRMLRLEALNHRLYEAFFAERTRWYAARGKKKPPAELPGGDMLDIVAEDSADDA